MIRSVDDNQRLPTPAPSPRVRIRSRRGFTLLETMLALIIIGLGVLAFVDAQASFARTNSWSSHASTAMLLANEVREMVRRLPRHDPVTGLYIDAGNGNALVGWSLENGEVTPRDIDDIDDLDGLQFGNGGNMAGPIDANGDVVPATTLNGQVVLDANGFPVPLAGWSQRIVVDKVDPYNFNIIRNANYVQAATSQLPGIAVDQFPLKVTVIVEFQAVNDLNPREMTRVTWITPR